MHPKLRKVREYENLYMVEWGDGMLRKCVSLFLFLLLIMALLAANGRGSGNQHDLSFGSLCKFDLESGVKDLVARQFRPTAKKIAVILHASNDPMFHHNERTGEPECMANVGVYLGGDLRLFTIFHAHFSPNGKWIPQSFVANDGGVPLFDFYAPIWVPLEKEDDWHKYWCNFLDTSLDRYKIEKSKFGCK